ncbi:MAG: Phosphoribosylamine--glycine ligase [uncultured Solirubrobacteraceae bacterium]|uniref:Multifunctional fusion protein n=1 Tax=uncultured Solirubrobacteraceae bacterium TaxID=1162706 RepID=A0A6J4R1D9_9ACTN|nr:MAG: Phosphoribosylamine--glycine ligase [uncultured Solirubrobacteraceae bacterium]
MTRVIVVGAGGREHALVRALARSPQRPQVLSAPGNPGIADDAAVFAEASPDDVDGFAAAAAAAGVGLVVIGPEAPLVAGLADALARAGVPCFGPSAAAARLEASKAFAKDVMAAAGVPTAAHATVDTVADGLAAISSYPAVLKFDGLAAGKGVVIAGSADEARAALTEMLEQRRFGPGPVVVEEFLDGEEVSLLALCDGERAVPLQPARDFKRIGEGDTGPNTGGMGAFSPVPGIDPALVEGMVATVHQPVVDELRRRGTPFHGVLYAGLMVGPAGVRTLEFNVRFGDPETQAVLPRLRSDLLDLLARAARPGGLAGAELEWDERSAVTLVLAAGGYPDAPRTGEEILGLDAVAPGIEVTHAGTRRAGGRILTAGGRVLNVTALGDTLRSARAAAYAAADAITFEGRQLRRDIAAAAGGSMSDLPEAIPGVDMVPESAPAPATVAEEQVEAALDELDSDAPLVGIVMGSASEKPAMEEAATELEERGILHEVRVMSADGDTDLVADYARNAHMRGLRVIIVGAGASAALPGVVAAHTDLPVIGVPLTSPEASAGGLDAVLSIAQAPPGLPVACVGVDSARNAALLAVRILGSAS